MVMKKYLRLIIFSLLTICFSQFVFASSGGSIVCKGQYVLCASAPCVPIPGEKGKAMCYCKIYNGSSIGNKTCAKRQEKTGPYGYKLLTSTYSFAEANKDKVLQCPSGSPWTDCLDAPCVANPAYPGHAVCTCPIIRTGAFVTYGGNCNKAMCKKRIWSGATQAGYERGSKALMKALHLTSMPAEYCAN